LSWWLAEWGRLVLGVRGPGMVGRGLLCWWAARADLRRFTLSVVLDARSAPWPASAGLFLARGLIPWPSVGGEAVRDAIVSAIITLPAQLRRWTGRTVPVTDRFGVPVGVAVRRAALTRRSPLASL
jgi:hypothetical protein